MTDAITLTIDGREIEARRGQTILEAANAAGIYIPRLCWRKGLTPFGACRVCTVHVNGRPQSACTQPAGQGLVVENDTEELLAHRRNIIDMLFVEGNHICPACEKSGDCELQALAYRFGITAPKYPFMFPQRELDASHPDIFLDRNRCVLCSRCVRASTELDGKHAYGFTGRGPEKRIAANSATGIAGTTAAATDEAVAACPTGALLAKRTAYTVPVGQRPYDNVPIGDDVEHAKG